MKASILLVPFNNADKTVERLTRDIVPSMKHYPLWNFDLICIDNSNTGDSKIFDSLSASGFPFHYFWVGKNKKLAWAKNKAFQISSADFLIYACTNHGQMFDPTWLEDLLQPFDDERVAMSGSLCTTNKTHATIVEQAETTETIATNDLDDVLFQYIQGGIIAARVDVMRDLPYSAKYPHIYSDLWMSWKLQHSGYKLANVATVYSGHNVPIGTDFKYIHLTPKNRKGLSCQATNLTMPPKSKPLLMI